MLAGGIVNKAISSDELESEEMRRVTVEKQPRISFVHLNSIVSMTLNLACCEANAMSPV